MAYKARPKKVRSRVTTEATVKTFKTLDERIEDAKAKLAKLLEQKAAQEAKAQQEALKNDVREKDEVTFVFGRGDSKREMGGTVLGSADSGTGLIVAIMVKDENGLPDVKRVNVAAIIANKTADERNKVEPASEEGPNEANPADRDPAVSEDRDPLDAE